MRRALQRKKTFDSHPALPTQRERDIDIDYIVRCIFHRTSLPANAFENWKVQIDGSDSKLEHDLNDFPIFFSPHMPTCLENMGSRLEAMAYSNFKSRLFIKVHVSAFIINISAPPLHGYQWACTAASVQLDSHESSTFDGSNSASIQGDPAPQPGCFRPPRATDTLPTCCQ